MILIGLLGKLKSSFGNSSIDSKIDTAFAHNPANLNVPKSSVSERVLEGHKKFGDQFQDTPASPPASYERQFGQASESNYGRFAEPDTPTNPNPIDFNDNLDMAEPPQTPPPLQIRRDAPEFQQKSPSPVASSLQAVKKPLEFPSANTNIPETVRDYSKSAPSIEQRMIDEMEDIKAQNNEILRRLQRLEARMR